MLDEFPSGPVRVDDGSEKTCWPVKNRLVVDRVVAVPLE